MFKGPNSFKLKSVKSNKLFNIASVIPAVIGLMSAAFMGYAFWWPVEAAYQVDRPQDHAVTYDAGTNTIRIHRYYCVTASIPITISRDLIRIGKTGEHELRISLPQTVQLYELGCHGIDRIFETPVGTPPGNYRLVNVATWKANPFKEGMVKLPELYLAIPSTP